jgi:hypothetical protein
MKKKHRVSIAFSQPQRVCSLLGVNVQLFLQSVQFESKHMLHVHIFLGQCCSSTDLQLL